MVTLKCSILNMHFKGAVRTKVLHTPRTRATEDPFFTGSVIRGQGLSDRPSTSIIINMGH